MEDYTMTEKFDFEQALEALKAGKPITGKDSVLGPLVKQLTEAALEAEIDTRRLPQKSAQVITGGFWQDSCQETLMKRSRFTEHQIISILKEADAGAKVKDVCRRHGISDATYYNWKSKYGGMQASDLKRMKEMQGELGQYKRMYAELAHENFALKDVIDRKL
jgi:putative transposase